MQDDISIDEVARRIAKDTGGFTGGDLKLFGEAGKFSFTSLKRNGLKRSSRVLDYGCGALRLGYWLIRFLKPNCYFGIEPSERFLSAGIKHAVGPELEAEKRPRFHQADDFDFSVFGEKFDFVIARSIFSHASPEQFLKAMESFRDNTTDAGIMLASYRPMQRRDDGKGFADPNPDGPAWRLRRFSLEFLQENARARGLFAYDFGKPFNGQIWLRLSKTDPIAATSQ